MLGQRNGNSSFEILKVTQRVEVESRCSIGMEAGEIIIMIDRARKKIIFFFFFRSYFSNDDRNWCIAELGTNFWGIWWPSNSTKILFQKDVQRNCPARNANFSYKWKIRKIGEKNEFSNNYRTNGCITERKGKNSSILFHPRVISFRFACNLIRILPLIPNHRKRPARTHGYPR